MKPIENFRAFIISWLLLMTTTLAIFAILGSLPVNSTLRMIVALVFAAITTTMAFHSFFYETIGNAVARWVRRRWT